MVLWSRVHGRTLSHLPHGFTAGLGQVVGGELHGGHRPLLSAVPASTCLSLTTHGGSVVTAPLLSEFLLKCTLCLWQLARLGLQLMLSWQYREDIESISTFVSQPSKCTFAHQSVWFGNKLSHCPPTVACQVSRAAITRVEDENASHHPSPSAN